MMKDLIEKIKEQVDLRIAVIIGLSIIMLLLLIQILFFPDLFKAPLAVTNTYPAQDGQIDTTGSLTFRFNRDLEVDDISISDNYGTEYALSKVESAVISARPSTVFIPRSYTVTVSHDTTMLKDLSFTVVDATSVEIEAGTESDDNKTPALDLTRLANDSPIANDNFTIVYSNGDVLISINPEVPEAQMMLVNVLKSYGVPSNYERLSITEWSEEYIQDLDKVYPELDLNYE